MMESQCNPELQAYLDQHMVQCISLRDYFAAAAMTIAASDYTRETGECDFDCIARNAYMLADSMLAAREKRD